MAIRNQNWYDLQANRRYPLDERSTGVDDAGAPIHDDILADCHIRFPSNLGQYLFVQGVTVAPSLVTVVFGIAADLNDTEPVTVAAVSLPRTAAQNVNHAITPLADGVAGWVVLGPGLDEEFAGRYSTPIQTLVSPRCARPYRPLPIPSLGKLNLATSLQGIITLSAQAPVTATYIPATDAQALTVDGAPINAILFKLEGELQGFNPLREFLGPCGQRPESGTCPKPPIATINGISPDCDGNINLVFDGFDTAVFENCGGVDVISNTGLSEACAANNDRRRRTPQDKCTPGTESIDDGTWYDPTTQLPDPPTPPDVVESESLFDDSVIDYCILPPICTDFEAADASAFTVREGLFVFESVSAPETCNPASSLAATPENNFVDHYVYSAANIVGRNLALFKNCASDWALGKTIGAELQITADGLQRNGGIVLNYLPGSSALGTPTRYLAALVDAAAGQLKLIRFNGTSFVTEYSAAMETIVGTWYRVSATPVLSGSTVVVTVAVEAVDDSVTPVSFAVPISNYGDPIGQAGLLSLSAYTRFNKFTIED
jgi:hypothetical protein